MQFTQLLPNIEEDNGEKLKIKAKKLDFLEYPHRLQLSKLENGSENSLQYRWVLGTH